MKHLLPLAFLMLISSPSFAKHIIGAVLSYECLGGGTYRFTMKMYRDCTDPTGAGFDNPARFSIYKGDFQTHFDVIDVESANYDVITDIEPDVDNPCLILPPNTCVEEAIYEFVYTFQDWPSNESYHITYQRCCRNATVVNIQTPGDVGATFTVELTPASQLVCNDSPTFETLPPIVICAGVELEYDHSAVDEEGDQLIYELCEPLIGGGQDGLGGGPGTPGFPCDDVVPNPSCPPPYETVQYVAPFSALNPMGGNPAITIDAITGMLTGTPDALGQYAVGICIYEYRNGQLLSVIRRDFQFNVANCEPLVDADIISDDFENEEYIFERCEGLEIHIENLSPTTNVNNFAWQFMIDSQLVTNTTDWDLDITFPSTGSYEGLLMLNPGSMCGDTADIRVTLYPEIFVDFEFDYDTCFAGPVTFLQDVSIDAPGKIDHYKWEFGDGDTSDVLNPVHVYEEPGNYFTSLIVSDTFGCHNSFIRQVNYQPVPAVLVVAPNDTLSCPPAEVIFNNLSNPVDLSYQVNWDFGDGQTSKTLSPTHVYQEEGLYTVSLEIISPIGCVTDTVFENLIEIVPPPMADFYVDPPLLSNLQPNGSFIDQSIDAAHWEWHVNDELIAHRQNVENYTFPDTGLHKVTLYITHPEKCQDTLTKFVDVVPKWFFHLPNAFTPNEDTVNDLFIGKGLIPGITNFRMQIWDRWGQMVFETDNPYEGWNGHVDNVGRSAQEGVYMVLVSFVGPRGAPYEYQGYATVVR